MSIQDERDRPTATGGIEVTSAMVRVGVSELVEYDWKAESEEEREACIYQAIEKAKSLVLEDQAKRFCVLSLSK